MAIDANPNVKILTGQDKVFKIRLIGELKIQNISQSIKKIHTKSIIELFVIDSIISIFIPNQ